MVLDYPYTMDICNKDIGMYMCIYVLAMYSCTIYIHIYIYI